MRVKASAVGLAAEEYRAELAVDSGWTGMAELDVTVEEMDAALRRRAGVEHEAAARAALPHRAGAALPARQRPRPGQRRTSSIRLVRGDRDAFGLHGRSAEQRIALDLLLDPDVGIVCLGGRAGTGKSALALCAGLEAVMERRQHRKVVVFRPLYAVGGQELGYLPGSEAEKMSPWAQAVFDTLGGAGLQRGRRGGHRPRHARGAAAHPHPRALAARRLRHRRRGPVAGAQRAADRAVPDRPELPGGAHPRRRAARQPPGRPARRRRRRDRGAQGPPAVRPRHADPLRALARSRPWSPSCWRAWRSEQPQTCRCPVPAAPCARLHKGRPFVAGIALFLRDM